MQAIGRQPSTTNLRRNNNHSAAANILPVIGAYKDGRFKANRNKEGSNRAIKLAESLTNFINLKIETASNDRRSRFASIEDKAEAPVSSPKENISGEWRELHGCREWEGLLDPLHTSLRREIVKYGEFAQVTYDALDSDYYSEYSGSCRYSPRKLFDEMSLTKSGYRVVNYMYAMSRIDLPEWLEASRLVNRWSKDSNWIGFVAVSDDEETRRIGRRDIAVAWRGTVTPTEWYENTQNKLQPIGQGDARVEQGFLSIYTSKCPSSPYNRSSASEQVMRELRDLVDVSREKGEEVSLTITGHSLGGALAALNAYEAAATFPGLPITVISFASPRVGNIAFRDELYQMGVKTLRVTVKQDRVPRMPGVIFNESLQKFDDLTGTLDWMYTHVGAELKLDVRASPYLKRRPNPMGIHMLETYLHLVDGWVSRSSTFRWDAKRDVALVNKDCDMLVGELRVPPNWYQLANKGMVRNSWGRWVRPKREPQDIPSLIM
ncbi:hypothetical protein DM860_007921 [Cuscuta australis]|uniref:Fungal lipase-type domain-containing protein n=1 Tax=Cuscuta australis TaxID=267555 RepID=A0A328DWY0_9ASTE|nr:hypothetical protein DM860_007921 [Cuscuta australis]